MPIFHISIHKWKYSRKKNTISRRELQIVTIINWNRMKLILASIPSQQHREELNGENKTTELCIKSAIKSKECDEIHINGRKENYLLNIIILIWCIQVMLTEFRIKQKTFFIQWIRFDYTIRWCDFIIIRVNRCIAFNKIIIFKRQL